jgi:hypothetical protein
VSEEQSRSIKDFPFCFISDEGETGGCSFPKCTYSGDDIKDHIIIEHPRREIECKRCRNFIHLEGEEICSYCKDEIENNERISIPQRKNVPVFDEKSSVIKKYEEKHGVKIMKKRDQRVEKSCLWCGTKHTCRGDYCCTSHGQKGWYYTKGDGKRRLKAGSLPMEKRIVPAYRKNEEPTTEIKKKLNRVLDKIDKKAREVSKMPKKDNKIMTKEEKIVEEIRKVCDADIFDKHKIWLMQKILKDAIETKK